MEPIVTKANIAYRGIRVMWLEDKSLEITKIPRNKIEIVRTVMSASNYN